MSQEIIEGIRTIEREKGIEAGTLIAALEDALLAAYKKTPGAARHATVELDDDGEFRVFALDIPDDLEARLLEEARERAIDELERIEEETGEKQHTLIVDDELDLDWEQVPDELVDKSDATPDDFGRIAAMTAKQVIQQRIREAERAMMYEEYVDRRGEVVTGIVQQAGDRNNVLVDLGKVEALLPRSEQVDGERYEQGSRIKAVITEVRSGTKGPQVILSRRAPQRASSRCPCSGWISPRYTTSGTANRNGTCATRSRLPSSWHRACCGSTRSRRAWPREKAIAVRRVARWAPSSRGSRRRRAPLSW